MTRTWRLVLPVLGVMAFIATGVVTVAPEASAQPAPGACALPPSRVAGVGGGIQWAARTPGDTTCATRRAVAGGSTLPSPAFNGSPPLLFHGGSVAGTTARGQVTVTPVYWVPSTGTRHYSIPASYKNLINRFIADAAATSGKSTNVFSVLTEYTKAGGTHLSYNLRAGTPVTDTHAYPANGCTPDSGAIWSDGTHYTECITNAQLLNEAQRFTAAAGLPNRDLAHLYMYFLPEGWETCFTSANGAQGGGCSLNASGHGFCGYHAFDAPPLVADMNYAFVDSPSGETRSSDGGSNTGANQSPTADIAADTEISVASHEISETITDPEGSAWWDGSGNEIGDDCSYVYGDSASFQGTFGAYSNQMINGHRYFIQEEFSNRDYAAKNAYSCIQKEARVIVTPGSGPAATHVSLSGGGFASGETVKVSYYTTASTPVTVCSATSTSAGSFQCSGNVPSSAGAVGPHKILARGATSLRKAFGTFTRT